jgi:cation diffusion facilitator CzcD-associated flavoprotein CzcO
MLNVAKILARPESGQSNTAIMSEFQGISIKKTIFRENLLVEIFDAIFACTGHHSTPYLPPLFSGQSDFKGRIIHSRSYTNGLEFANQRVLVVGLGNSGGDIAVELSRISNKVG